MTRHSTRSGKDAKLQLINKQNIPKQQQYLAIKSNEVLIHATTWRNIENMVSKRKAQSFSHVQLFTSPWTVACQAPVNGILGARILESVAIFFSKGAYLPRMETASLASPILADRFFTTSATDRKCHMLYVAFSIQNQRVRISLLEL